MSSPTPKDLLKFRADPLLRRAIRLRAALDDIDLQDVVVAALQKYLVEEIAEVQRRGLLDDPKSTLSKEQERKQRRER
jgi:hypothetical protein